MVEAHAPGVQGVALELERRSIVVRERLIRTTREDLGIRAVKLVADNRAANRRKVHANLVLASGFEIALHEPVVALAPPRPPEDRESGRCA